MDQDTLYDYGKIENDASETLLSNPAFVRKSEPAPSKRIAKSAITFIILLFAITSSLAVGFFIGRMLPTDIARDVMPLIQQYSPMFEDLDVKYSVVQFNGTFLHENIYRQDANPEVDAAWDAIGANYKSLVVPEGLAEKAGIAHDQVKVSNKYGGGFPANVEGLHHLHCLNLLRQSLYWNYDYYRDLGKYAWKNEGHIVKKHITHCLDILRQQLQCSVDVGVLGQVWWDSNARKPHLPPDPSPFTDFNTHHKCRNFEAIRQWAEVRQLPDQVPEDFLEPPKAGDRVYDSIP